MKEEIRNKIDDLFKSTPDNVGVGWGKKRIGGVVTDELCIVFGVEEKKPLDELNEDEILPSSVEIDGEYYKTDVIQVGKMRAMVSCYPSIAGNCANCDTNTAVPCFQTWCPNDYDPDDDLKNTTFHIDNQDRQSYLSGGIQISSNNNFPVGAPGGAVGTLGMIAVDNVTDALVGITNNHVVVGNPFYTTQRIELNDENELDDTVYQSYSAVGYEVGKVIRYVPINKSGTNSVDGALFSVNSDMISLSNSYKQFGLSYTSPMTFASTAEINDLVSVAPLLYSSGRTTGAKEGAICGLITTSSSYSTNISSYYDGGVEISNVPFSNLILFSRIDDDCPYPIASGDSGSALIADFDGTWKIIGLVFAGSEFYGMACRIDQVAYQLDISAWDGTAKSYIDIASQEVVTESGASSLKTKVCSEKTYWQVGSGQYSNPC